MASSTPNMGLQTPDVGDSNYASSIDSSFTSIDDHDHTTGNGVQIPTAGIEDLAVTNAKLALVSVDTGNLIDASVTNAKLASDISFLPAGVVFPYGGTSAPTGYLLCNGASVLRATYADLFTAIGTAFGTVDGTTFNLPDFRGRFLRGVDGGQAVDPDAGTRTAMNAGGNTGDAVGSIQADELGSHNHSFSVYTAGANGGNPQGTDSASAFGSVNTSSSSGAETRPVNAYVNYIIKI